MIIIVNFNSYTVRPHYIFLVFLSILNFYPEISSGQTQHSGVVKARIVNSQTGNGINNVVVTVKHTSGEEWNTKTTDNGIFQFKLPNGVYFLKAQHQEYHDYFVETTFHAEIENHLEFPMISFQDVPPWKYSKPFPELEGVWKFVSYKKGRKKIKQTKKENLSLHFYYTADNQPGKIQWWSDLYNHNPIYFKHFGDGKLELSEKQNFDSNGETKTNSSFLKFIQKVRGNVSIAKIIHSGKVLLLHFENETITFEKQQEVNKEFKQELRGVWTPVKAIINGKNNNFTDNDLNILFFRDTDLFYGPNIETKVNCDKNAIQVLYRFMSNERTFLQFYCPSNNKLLLDFIDKNYQGTCQVLFNTVNKTLTLKYVNSQLVLKRKKS